MTHVRTSRFAAAALVGALILTACGLKPGVEVRGGAGGTQALARDAGSGTPGGDVATEGGTESAPGAGATAGGTGSGAQSAGGGSQDAGGQQSGATNQQAGSTAGNAGAGTGGGDAGGNGGTGGTGGEGGTSDGGGGQVAVSGSDRTGVTDNSITVAFHAPVTGAAPLPAESFREARDLYWRQKSEEGRTFLGRETVEVLFQDDKYDPANARQVCRQLAAEAFIVAGGGGTDQIQACGQLAGVEQFPYFSAGVTEAGLDGNPWYFASSMTYRQQGILLAQYIRQNFPNQTFSAIITDTKNFDDALTGFEAGIEQAGIGDNYVPAERHPKGDSSWYNTFAERMDSNGVEVLYMLTSPVDYIAFAQQANQSGYGPFQYVGVGVSMGLNAVLNSGCPDVDGGIFFSPFPGLDWARQNVPAFFQASDDFGTVADDLAFALWGINKQLDLLFQRYEQTFGTDLTREDFRALVEGGGPIESNIFPAVSYSQGNHFGGQSVHVLRADCSKGENGEYVTLATFKSSF